MLCFNCPNCNEYYEVDDSLSGKKVRCENCEAVFYITAEPGAAQTEMADMDRTMAPRAMSQNVMDSYATMPGMRNRGAGEQFDVGNDATLPGQRDRKPDGRFDVGDLIMGRYKVLAELGQGGMGVVYRCFDETAGIEVALKALPPELSHSAIEMEDIKDNFQLVAKLVHQNIAISKNLERDNSNGNYYLIMECVEGEDLRRWIRRKRKEGSLALNDILPIVKQIADALDYAHKQKIIHRDIKPGNIMINNEGEIKVLDFGLAAQIHTSMTRVSMVYHGVSGTGPYMAPEQWQGLMQDAKTDQYALAVMTYELLAGHLPFENPDVAVLREVVLNGNIAPVANVSKYVNAALQRALSKDPSLRFDTCMDFALSLGGKKIKSAQKPLKIVPWQWGAIAGCLFFIGFGSYFLFKDKTQVEEIASSPSAPASAVSVPSTPTATTASSSTPSAPVSAVSVPSTPTATTASSSTPSAPAPTTVTPKQNALPDLDLKKIAADEKEGIEFSENKRTLTKAPKYIEGIYKIPQGVTIIGWQAFRGCSNLQSVTIPNSVTSIEGRAFSECSNLQSVTIPDSVTSIGREAFFECSSLQSVTIPDSVTSIGEFAFIGCSSLQSVTIPDSVTSIEGYAFHSCSSLQSITIPNSVTSIGESAFSGCKKLRKIKLPNNLKIISKGTFGGSLNLTLHIPAGIKMIEPRAFHEIKKVTSSNKTFIVDKYGVLIDHKRQKILYAPPSLSGNYKITDNIKSIDEYVFYDCDKLQSVSIPAGLAFDSRTFHRNIKIIKR